MPHVIDDGTVANGDFATLINTWLPANQDTTGQQALLQMNHPWASSSRNSEEYGRNDFTSVTQWRQRVDARAQLICVANGPSHSTGTNRTPHISDSEFRRYLNLGFHLAPTADQDNHRATWGTITDARTAVIANTLDKPSILNALRARHAYATLDENLQIITTVQGALCGDIVAEPAANAELAIEVFITDDDEPTQTFWMEVFVDDVGGSRARLQATYGPLTATAADEVWVLGGLQYGGWDYLYFRVWEGPEDSAERVAWIAPVWFE